MAPDCYLCLGPLEGAVVNREELVAAPMVCLLQKTKHLVGTEVSTGLLALRITLLSITRKPLQYRSMFTTSPPGMPNKRLSYISG